MALGGEGVGTVAESRLAKNGVKGCDLVGAPEGVREGLCVATLNLEVAAGFVPVRDLARPEELIRKCIVVSTYDSPDEPESTLRECRPEFRDLLVIETLAGLVIDDGSAGWRCGEECLAAKAAEDVSDALAVAARYDEVGLLLE